MPNYLVEPKSAALLFTGAAIGIVGMKLANDSEGTLQTVSNINDALTPVYKVLPYVGLLAAGALGGAAYTISRIPPLRF